VVEPLPEPADPRPLVLVVDDEVNLAVLVAMHMERAGCRVITAHDGGEAVELVRARRPALVVLDVMMPVLNGYEVTKLVRADNATREIPIVLLTARQGGGDELYGLRVGAERYIRKPFDSEHLRGTVRELLGERRASF
jgi:twitching motility two-component system response regulator PilH